jgi:hypothetical protein
MHITNWCTEVRVDAWNYTGVQYLEVARNRNPPRPVNPEAGEDLIGDLLGRQAAFGGDDHAFGQNPIAFHDWLLAGNLFHIWTIRPIDIAHGVFGLWR